MAKKIPGKCPKCGCTDAFISGSVSGRWEIALNLEERTVDSEEMYEGVRCHGGVLVHCNRCNYTLGRVEDWDGEGLCFIREEVSD